MIWTTKELGKALLLNIAGNREFGKVQFNSKDVEQGDIFIALKGVRDGHEFVLDALDRGASVAIVSKKISNVDQAKLIMVEDTYEALMDLAEFKRRNSKAKFIAITGSVGKTSTKEATKIMLSAYGKTHASHGTFNNYLGVPLCLASMPNDTEYAVIEMGMSAKGELSELSKLAIPDVALITAVSEGHIGSFNSVEEIADAKCEIFEGMDINDGIAIVNRDITDKPTEDYWIQMQMQMETCNLDECDFIETRFKEFSNENDFFDFKINDNNFCKGVILSFVNKDFVNYENNIQNVEKKYFYFNHYDPENDFTKQTLDEYVCEYKKNLKNDYILYEINYWYLDEFSCILVKRNKQWFNSAIHKIQDTWNIIQNEKITGFEHRDTKKNKITITINKDTESQIITNMPKSNNICLIKLDEKGNTL